MKPIITDMDGIERELIGIEGDQWKIAEPVILTEEEYPYNIRLEWKKVCHNIGLPFQVKITGRKNYSSNGSIKLRCLITAIRDGEDNEMFTGYAYVK